MSIEAIGAVGELIAGLATVATLVYLALQIRQFTLSGNADRQLAVQSDFSRMHEQVVGDEGLAKLLARCRDEVLEDLAPADDERLQAYVNGVANAFSSIELSYRRGQFNEGEYLDYCNNFAYFCERYPALVPRIREMVELNHIGHYKIFATVQSDSSDKGFD